MIESFVNCTSFNRSHIPSFMGEVRQNRRVAIVVVGGVFGRLVVLEPENP